MYITQHGNGILGLSSFPNVSGIRPSSESVLIDEAAGSADTVHSEKLPMEGIIGNEAVYTGLGFKLGKKIDSVMMEVTLPSGWRKVASKQDPRHIELQDSDGVCRGSVFIKTTGYDYYGSTSLRR